MADGSSAMGWEMIAEPAFWSYAAALAAFTLFALQLWFGWRGGAMPPYCLPPSY